ncbi:MAG TPA: CAP domain-containing protein [Isosphaeraceae bacterium]|nr:CAP domain-containing protein [Isosphaeraceae bacterium]
MPRPNFRRSLRFEILESRELLSGSFAAPTAQEQYMLELINQARMNPAAAAVRVTSNLTADISATVAHYGVDLNATEQAIASAAPQPPLDWNPDLAAAAQGHSDDMATNQFESHDGSDGSTADQRMQQAGYTSASSTGENAFAYATSIDEAMQAFLIDWGVPSLGHRANILQPNVSSNNAYQDVGIGIATTGPNSQVGPMVITQDFGSQSNQPAQLLGVAYYDNQHTGMYEIGEGTGGMQIDATNLTTGQITSTQTWNTGGYQMALKPGLYQITASFNGTVFQTLQVTIGTQNVEQDFVLSNTWDGRTRDQVINSLVPAATPPQPTASVSTPSVAPAATPPQPTASVSTPSVVPAATPPQSTATVSTPPVNPLPTFSGSWTSWQAQVA